MKRLHNFMNENMVQDEQLEEDRPTHGKRVYVYLVMVLLIVVSLFSVKATWQRFIPVKHVFVEGISIVSKEEIVRLMKLSPSVSMYDIDLSAVQRNILTNSFVKSVVIHRDAPAALRVVIEERKPSAILAASEMFYIASDGTVLPYISSSETYDIPVISGMDSLTGIRTGKKLFNSDVQEALKIINAANATSDEISHSISEIHLRKGHDLILYTFESGAPIIFGKGDVVKKIVKLDAFWQQFIKNTETSDIQYIDIRFDDQVVVSRKNS